MTCSVTVVAFSSAYNAPMTTTPCTKFEPDMSGVCRMAGTRLMTSYPAKAASMKMYRAKNPVMPSSNTGFHSRTERGRLPDHVLVCLHKLPNSFVRSEEHTSELQSPVHLVC